MAENTPGYGLKQWDSHNKPTMEEFNSDNQKIDAALTALSGNSAAAKAGLATLSEK